MFHSQRLLVALRKHGRNSEILGTTTRIRLETRNDAGTRYILASKPRTFPRYAAAEMQCWNQNEHAFDLRHPSCCRRHHQLACAS